MAHCFRLVTLMFFLVAGSLSAVASSVNMSVSHAPLRDVLKKLAADSGMDLYLDKSITGHVTAHFSNAPLSSVLSRVLRHRSYVLSYDSLGAPRALWLIREGSTDYEVVRGYHGADGINSTFVWHPDDASTTSAASHPAPSTVVAGLPQGKVQGAMGAAVVRQAASSQQQVVQQQGWHWVSSKQHTASRQAQLRRKLASAAPEDRINIVKEITQSQQQDNAVASASAVQSVTGQKRLVALTKLKRQVALPTQHLTLAAQRQRVQLAQLRQQRQLQARLTQQRSNLFRIRNNQPSSGWGVR